MSDVTLISDPRVAAVPVHESGEPPVDLRAEPVLVSADHPRVGRRAPTQFHCREGVARRLVSVDAALANGIRLLVLECHRPVELQARHWEEDLAKLRSRHPDWPRDRLFEENARLIAPPWGGPPHSTGGAVDLTLVDERGREMEMGSPLNAGGPLAYTAAPDVGDRARENRRTLLAAMQDAGFVNYGFEWWHYSYGDKYWAFETGEPAARYGTV